MSTDYFKILILTHILHFPVAPGKLIVIYKTDLPQASQIGDMTTYISDDVKHALAYNQYLLIDELCTPDYFIVLDIHIGYKDHLDFVSRVKYSYDTNKGDVIMQELDSFPVDPDFSMTPEQLDALVSSMRPKFVPTDIVKVKGKRGKWKVVYVYNPWEQNSSYALLYSGMKIQNPSETYFYALNAINNKQKPIVALEQDIELIQ